MFVCICKGIRKSDLETLVKEKGPLSDVVKQITGASTECGTCELRLQRVLKEIEAQSKSDSIDAKEAAG